ncbi:uncharacterized protein B0T23DRAFT_380853 [Neurospora hispaniola]|uniref:Uncharacterized protein n=1 Tax=Neurospora hispaniola TaxID=588809 RepID=A0AAJ0I8S6_9PEZI|nr:hypothetical protein B0T23DRAFT_380853 [Neurospora hispaniola]
MQRPGTTDRLRHANKKLLICFFFSGLFAELHAELGFAAFPPGTNALDLGDEVTTDCPFLSMGWFVLVQHATQANCYDHHVAVKTFFFSLCRSRP